jgi:hypothetical protein
MKVAMVVSPLQGSTLIAELSFLPLGDLSPTAMRIVEAQPNNQETIIRKNDSSIYSPPPFHWSYFSKRSSNINAPFFAKLFDW